VGCAATQGTRRKYQAVALTYLEALTLQQVSCVQRALQARWNLSQLWGGAGGGGCGIRTLTLEAGRQIQAKAKASEYTRR
jgi:hypothetical protein